MENYSPELQTFLNLLQKKTKMVAMLAPAYLIDFEYPQIAGKLKRLGFQYVVEVAAGALGTNADLVCLMKKNPPERYITSPCPTIVRLIRQQYPRLVKYLAPVASPMIQSAKLVIKKYPNYQPVFIGPCLLKKKEASEDYPQLNLIVLTFQELQKVFEILKIADDSADSQARFDIVGEPTRLYPISGGFAQSSHVNGLLSRDEYQVISGFKQVNEALNGFEKNQSIKLLDILFCDGGCISGPGIINHSLSLSERRQKVIDHWQKKSSNS